MKNIAPIYFTLLDTNFIQLICYKKTNVYHLTRGEYKVWGIEQYGTNKILEMFLNSSNLNSNLNVMRFYFNDNLYK